MIWRQAGFMSLVHCGVSRFDMFGEKLGIEQRRRQAVVGQLALYFRQFFRIRRQLNRQTLVVFQRCRYEFGQMNRV